MGDVVDGFGPPAPRGARGAERRQCTRHRAVLLDLLEQGATGDEVESSIEHLERCRDCERELARTALVLSALRRLADDAQAAVPAEPAWSAISARIVEAPRPRWRPGSLAGAVASLALVFVLAGPMLLRRPQPAPELPPAAPTSTTAAATAPPAAIAPAGGSAPRTGLAIAASDLQPDLTGVPARYPDNLKPGTDKLSAAQGGS